MKAPAFQFYPADWRKDPGVQALGYFERGVWFEIICLLHESTERGVLLLNGAPMPESALANILGLDNQTLEGCLTKIKAYGVAKVRQEDGAIYSKRMVDDERISKIRKEAGKLGGNPLLVNQAANQIPTPSSSSSSSDQKPEQKHGAAEKRGARIPSGWSPSDESLSWAKANRPDLNLGEITAAFVDHWEAEAGARARKLDWDKTWKNWIRRQNRNATGTRNSKQSVVDRIAQNIADSRAARGSIIEGELADP